MLLFGYFGSLFVASTVVLLLAGCANMANTPLVSNSQELSPGTRAESPAPPLVHVTQEAVDEAAKTLVREVDEFTNDEEVRYHKPLASYSSSETGSNSHVGTLMGAFSRVSGGDWKFSFGGVYLGEEWKYWDTIEMMSPTGSLKYKVSRQNKSEEIIGGLSVLEQGALFLADSEVVDLYELAKGGDIKFRLGSPDTFGNYPFVGVLKGELRQKLVNVMTVFFGERQGLNVSYNSN
jgi:hypothetical protein